MNKKQKEEFYELFAQAFREVVIPLLENIPTKDDLKRETSWLRDDINGLKADLSTTPSRGEFNKLEEKIDKFITQ